MEFFQVAAYCNDIGNRRTAVECEDRNRTTRIECAENGVNCSPLRKSTCTVGTVRPFSARKIRTRRGLGAVAQSVEFHRVSPGSWILNRNHAKSRHQRHQMEFEFDRI